MAAKTKDDEAMRALEALEKLLEDRIADLHEVRGGQQARHAFVYYRSLVWTAQAAFDKPR